MPKITKAPESPIRKRVQELCNQYLLVSDPELVNIVEENLIEQISKEIIFAAHTKVLASRGVTINPAPPATPATSKKTAPTAPLAPAPAPSPTPPGE